MQVLDEVATLEALSAPGKGGPIVIEGPFLSKLFQLPTTQSSSETPATGKPQVGESLTWEQHSSIDDLPEDFADVFSDDPGHCITLEYDIILTTTDRIQAKAYPVSIHLQPSFREEV